LTHISLQCNWIIAFNRLNFNSKLKETKMTTDHNTAMKDAFEKHGKKKQGNQGYTREQQGPIGLIASQSALGCGVSRTGNGEVLNSMVSALNECADKESFKIKLLPVERTTYNLPFSLILAATEADNGGHVAISTLILEGTGEDLGSREETVANNRKVPVKLTPGDLQSDSLWKICAEAAHGHFKNGATLHESGVIVIPRTLSVEDTPRLHSIIFDVAQSNSGILVRRTGLQQRAYSVDLWNPEKEQVSIKLGFHKSSTETGTGQIIRSDIQVDMRATTRNDGGTMDILTNNSLNVSTVTGYVDLAYEGVPQQQSAWGVPIAPQQQAGFGTPQTTAAPTACFVPRFVITNLDTGLNTVSTELHLQGLASCAILEEEFNFAKTFLPTEVGGVKSLHDIEGLQYDCPALAEFDIPAASNRTPQDLLQILSVAVHPNLIYSMDIEEAGAKSWVENIFLDAASGSKRALNEIYNSANVLTGGNFKYEGQFFIPGTTRIHNGYYIDNNGDKKDLREIDSLAMYNRVGETEPQAARDFADTFIDTVNSEAEVMRRREDILRAVIGDSVVITGYSRRINIHGDAINALAAACRAGGAVVIPDNIHRDMGVGSRPSANFSQYSRTQAQPSGLFAGRTGPVSYGNSQATGGRYNW